MIYGIHKPMPRRKKDDSQPQVTVSARVPVETVAEINYLASKWDRTKSDTIGRLIRYGLEAVINKDDPASIEMFDMWVNCSPQDRARLLAIARAFQNMQNSAPLPPGTDKAPRQPPDKGVGHLETNHFHMSGMGKPSDKLSPEATEDLKDAVSSVELEAGEDELDK